MSVEFIYLLVESVQPFGHVIISAACDVTSLGRLYRTGRDDTEAVVVCLLMADSVFHRLRYTRVGL